MCVNFLLSARTHAHTLTENQVEEEFISHFDGVVHVYVMDSCVVCEMAIENDVIIAI